MAHLTDPSRRALRERAARCASRASEPQASGLKTQDSRLTDHSPVHRPPPPLPSWHTGRGPPCAQEASGFAVAPSSTTGGQPGTRRRTPCDSAATSYCYSCRAAASISLRWRTARAVTRATARACCSRASRRSSSWRGRSRGEWHTGGTTGIGQATTTCRKHRRHALSHRAVSRIYDLGRLALGERPSALALTHSHRTRKAERCAR